MLDRELRSVALQSIEPNAYDLFLGSVRPFFFFRGIRPVGGGFEIDGKVVRVFDDKVEHAVIDRSIHPRADVRTGARMRRALDDFEMGEHGGSVKST